ncbi:hypothetical protein F4824DRAFT_504496 [Ustulina deusta]|nr:hypothetical protein F4824DRAFT_504496 [Ustulina deusta]
MDGVSLRHFQGGRVDYFNATTDEIITFCEQLQSGEELPALLKDPVYLRVKWEPKAYTTFLDFGLKDVGQRWPDRDVLFMSVVDITLINGNSRGNEFLMHLEEAATNIQEILNYHDV